MARAYCFRRNALYAALTLLLVVCGIGDVSGSDAMAADLSREMGKIKVEELKEISGLAASRKNAGVLWMNNDGESGRVFGVSTTGKFAALVKCPVVVDDVEEIALGPGPAEGVDYLYLGDIGDNSEKRPEIRVVRFAEPEFGGRRGQTIEVESAEEIRLVYPDVPHNAEAMLVDPMTGDLYIVTKERRRARLYVAAADQLREGTPARLRHAGSLDVDEISGAAISPVGDRVILRREKQGWLWPRQAGESVPAALERQPQKVQVLGKRQGPNGESVAFGPAGDTYFTVSEGKKQSIYEFALPAASDIAGEE